MLMSLIKRSQALTSVRTPGGIQQSNLPASGSGAPIAPGIPPGPPAGAVLPVHPDFMEARALLRAEGFRIRGSPDIPSLPWQAPSCAQIFSLKRELFVIRVVRQVGWKPKMLFDNGVKEVVLTYEGVYANDAMRIYADSHDIWSIIDNRMTSSKNRWVFQSDLDLERSVLRFQPFSRTPKVQVVVDKDEIVFVDFALNIQNMPFCEALPMTVDRRGTDAHASFKDRALWVVRFYCPPSPQEVMLFFDRGVVIRFQGQFFLPASLMEGARMKTCRTAIDISMPALCFNRANCASAALLAGLVSVGKFTIYSNNSKFVCMYDFKKHLRMFQGTVSVNREITYEESKTYVTSFKDTERPMLKSAKDLKLWHKGRHDAILAIVATQFGSSVKGDIKLSSTLGLRKFGKQTPDLVIVMSRLSAELRAVVRAHLTEIGIPPDAVENLEYVLADVAVSDHESMAPTRKANHYAGATEELDMKLELDFRAGRLLVRQRAIFVPFCVNLRECQMTNASMLDSDHRQLLRREVNILSRLGRKLQQMPNYLSLKMQVESNKGDEEDSLTLQSIDDLFPPVAAQGMSKSRGGVDSGHIDSDPILNQILTVARNYESRQLMADLDKAFAKLLKDDEFSKTKVLKSFIDSLDEDTIKDKVDSRRKELEEGGADTTGPRILKVPMFGERVNEKMTDVVTHIETYDEHSALRVINDNTACAKIPDHGIDFEARKKESKQSSGLEGMRLMDRDIKYVEDFLGYMGKKTFPAPFLAQEAMNHRMEDLQMEHKGEEAVIKEIFSLNAVKMAYVMQMIAKEISYNDLRKRFYNEEGEQMRVHKQSFICRHMEDVILEIHPGPILSKNFDMSFKLCAMGPRTKLQDDFEEMGAAYVCSKRRGSYCLETPWLTMDLESWRTYIRLGDTMTLMLYQKYSKARMHKTCTDLSSEKFMAPALFMMESRRGTSSANQLNRYLWHNMVCVTRDLVNNIDKIGSDPIRSKVTAFITDRQLKWVKKTVDRAKPLQEQVYKSLMTRTTSDYDKFFMPPFYGEEDIEVSESLDEAYYVSLMQTDMGNHGHRIKPVCGKLYKLESIWQEDPTNLKKMGITGPLGEFLKGEQKNFEFSGTHVHAFTKMFMREKLPGLRVKSLIKKLTGDLSQYCTMKSSVKSTYFEKLTSIGMKVTQDEVRSKAYETQRHVIEMTASVNILEYINSEEFFDLIFGLFEKGQLGGEREISILDMISRLQVRAVELFFEWLCEQVPEEMLTSGRDKYIQQNNYREQFINASKHSTKAVKVVFSYNKDKTEWSPNQNMASFLTMIDALPMGPQMKGFMTSIIRGFEDATYSLQGSLRAKVEKSLNEGTRTEANKDWYAFCDEVKAQGWKLRVTSGMGQGILHYLSSFYHCIAAYADKTLLQKFINDSSNQIEIMTQLSSDDRTDHFLVMTDSATSLSTIISVIEAVQYFVGKMFNIRQNNKKSGLSFICVEFNSCFMIGKRMIPLDIKSVFNTFEVPDFTYLEESAKQAVSSERRLFMDGVKTEVCQLARCLNRTFFMEMYRSRGLRREIMELLSIKDEDQLPYNLGFLPRHSVVASLFAGMDLYTQDPMNSTTLRKYWNFCYSGEFSDLAHPARKRFIHSQECAGKIGLCAATVFDSKIRKMREGLSNDEVKARLEENFWSLIYGVESGEEMRVTLDSYVMSVNRRYEFGDSDSIASITRALSAPRFQLRLYGMDLKDKKAQSNFDIMKFVLLAVEHSDNRLSYLDNPMFNIQKDVWRICREVEQSLERATVTDRSTHHFKVRNLHFKLPGHVHLISPLDIIKAYDNPLGAVSHANISMMEYMGTRFGVIQGQDFHETASLTFPDEPCPKVILHKMLQSICSLKDSMMVQAPFEFSDSHYFKPNFLNLMLYRSHPEFILALEEEPSGSYCGKDYCFYDNAAYLCATKEEFCNVVKHYKMEMREDFRPERDYTVEQAKLFYLSCCYKADGVNELWKLKTTYPLCLRFTTKNSTCFVDGTRVFVGATKDVLVLLATCEAPGSDSAHLYVVAEEKARDSLMSQVRTILLYMQQEFSSDMPNNDYCERPDIRVNIWSDFSVRYEMNMMNSRVQKMDFNDGNILYVNKLYDEENFDFIFNRKGSMRRLMRLCVRVIDLDMRLTLPIIRCGLPLVRLNIGEHQTPEFVKAYNTRMYFTLKYLYHANAQMRTDVLEFVASTVSEKQMALYRRFVTSDPIRSTRLWFAKYASEDAQSDISQLTNQERTEIYSTLRFDDFSGEPSEGFFAIQNTLLHGFMGQMEARNSQIANRIAEAAENMQEDYDIADPEEETGLALMGGLMTRLAEVIDFSILERSEADEQVLPEAEEKEDYETHIDMILGEAYRALFVLDLTALQILMKSLRDKKNEIENKYGYDFDPRFETNFKWSVVAGEIVRLDLDEATKVGMMCLLDKFEGGVLGEIRDCDLRMPVEVTESRLLAPKGSNAVSDAICRHRAGRQIDV